MVVVDGQGIPLGSHLTSASPCEVRLAERTLESVGATRRQLLRVIADRAYDSDPLRWRLIDQGVILISPHRRNRRAAPLNDGRWLRRYR